MGFHRDTFYRCQTALTATSIKSGKCQIKSPLLHASEVQQNATVTPSSSAFEWRSSEDCYHLADNGFGNQCNEIRFEIYEEANPERGITFDKFLQNPKKYNRQGIVITDAEIIEFWSKRSKLLRETDLNAVALRQKNWLAKHVG